MSKRRSTVVIDVSLADAAGDYDEQVTFLRRPFRIVRIGTSGDVDAAEELVRDWAEQADAIALTGAEEARALGWFDGSPDRVARVKAATDAVPVVDGRALHDVLQEWAIRRTNSEMPGYFTNARTVVLGGTNHDRTTRVLREFTPNLEFADPQLRFDLPARSSRPNPVSSS